MTGNRRAVPVLYSDPVGIDSHRVRLFLAEKAIAHDTESVIAGTANAELLAANPRAEVPTLVDRELVLHDTRTIIEYLDERHPHPPFMPIDPVSRARTRLALHRIETDWYALTPDRAGGGIDQAMASGRAARLAASLGESAELFRVMRFFLSGEYSILDATLAPLLWRLPRYGIVVDELADSVLAYARRLFARPAFVASLGERERDFGNAYGMGRPVRRSGGGRGKR